MAQLNNVKFLPETIPTRDILRILAKPSLIKFRLEKDTVTGSEDTQQRRALSK